MKSETDMTAKELGFKIGDFVKLNIGCTDGLVCKAFGVIVAGIRETAPQVEYWAEWHQSGFGGHKIDMVAAHKLELLDYAEFYTGLEDAGWTPLHIEADCTETFIALQRGKIGWAVAGLKLASA